MSRTVPLNSRYIMLIDLHSPVTYQKWVMAATMDPLGIQGGTIFLISKCKPLVSILIESVSHICFH